MKANYYFVLAVIILAFSCQKEEEVKEELEVEDAVVYEEFFIADVQGKDFEVLDPEAMGAKRSVGPKSGIPALRIDGYEKDYGYIFIYFCFYEGEGTYTTANKKDVGYSYLWKDNGEFWEDLSKMDTPSEIIITYADENVVEGTFEIIAYNNDDLSQKIEISGSFGLLLEEEGTEN